MREIKFRAWDGEKMYDWDYLQRFTSNWLNKDDRESSFRPMQYTGLKDKNGKEIYEGDIMALKYMGAAIPWEVKIVDGCFVIEGVGGIDYLKSSNKEFEVIGNIYENPELLEGK